METALHPEEPFRFALRDGPLRPAAHAERAALLRVKRKGVTKDEARLFHRPTV